MVMSSLFWLICSVNILTPAFAECQGLGRGFTVADLSGMCHPRTPGGYVVLERSCLVSIVNTLCCVTDSVYPQLCPSWPYSPASCSCDLRAMVVRQQQKLLSSFLGRGTSWMGVLSWSSRLFLYWNLRGIFMNEWVCVTTQEVQVMGQQSVIQDTFIRHLLWCS